MKRRNWALGLAAMATLGFASCTDDDPSVTPSANLELNINGLDALGANYAYEGWVIVNGQPVYTGVFSVDGSGTQARTRFTVDRINLNNASSFVHHIELSPYWTN